MSPIGEPELPASDLLALVRLRLFLERADIASRDQSLVGRHAALVAIDGACELALGLAAARLEAPDRSYKNVPELLAKVEELASWRSPRRREVRALHRARNAAQHETVIPDAGHLREWASAALEFIHGLIRQVFAVSLRDITHAEAIADDRLRARIAAADRALMAKDPTAAFEHAVAAFSDVLGRWRAQQEDAYGSGLYSSSFDRDPRLWDAHQRSEEWLDVGVFAADLGEYHWFAATRRQAAEGVPLAAQDAHRAMLFVFDWICRWEPFNARYPRERWRAHYAEMKPPTTEESGEPVAVGVRVGGKADIAGQHRTEFVVTIANLPEQGRSDWGQDMQYALDAAREATGHADLQIQPGSQSLSGDFTFFVAPGAPADAIAEVVRAALIEATASYHCRRLPDEVRGRDVEALVAPIRAVFDEDDSGLFGAVSGEHDLRPGGEVVVVTTQVLGPSNDVAVVGSVFQAQGGVLASLKSAPAAIRFDAFRIDDSGLDLLRSAIRKAVDQVEHVRRERASTLALRAELEQELNSLLLGRTTD